MKKFLLAGFCAAMLLTGSSASADTIGQKALMYLPNRVMDIFDIFSVSVGVGPTIRAELMATELIKVGGGYDFGSARIYKDWNRQYGLGLENGYYWSLVTAGEEDITRSNTIGWVKEYWESFGGVHTPNQPIYDYFEGKRDFWRIGGALGFLVEAEVYLNPIEWIDLGLGFLTIDIRQDDLRMDEF